MQYTIIPDIHADYSRLKWSIKIAEDSSIIFLGDLIDAGKNVVEPSDRQVLETVKDLISNKKAECILGNHELNAILFHRNFCTNNKPLRSHNNAHKLQHKSFIDQIGVKTSEAIYWTDWMLDTLPLWIEHENFRVVHACWSQKAVDIVKQRRPNGYLHRDDLEEIANKETDFALAVELLTSGPEVDLPIGFSFIDSREKERFSVRIAWWNSENATWRDAALSVPNVDDLPEDELPNDIKNEIYPKAAKPVFVGHYKMQGTPKIQSHNAVSLDFPHTPCVYKWNEENSLENQNIFIDER